jgi:hypothetical protein
MHYQHASPLSSLLLTCKSVPKLLMGEEGIWGGGGGDVNDNPHICVYILVVVIGWM